MKGIAFLVVCNLPTPPNLLESDLSVFFSTTHDVTCQKPFYIHAVRCKKDKHFQSCIRLHDDFISEAMFLEIVLCCDVRCLTYIVLFTIVIS